jgi:hypothetical protein
MGITILRRGIHRVVDTPFVRHLRVRLNDPDLVTFFNLETGQWILGYWLSRTRGMVDEIDDLGPRMELANRGLAEELVACRRVTDFRSVKRRLLRKRKAQAQEQLDSLEECHDQRAWLKKRGIPPPMYY